LAYVLQPILYILIYTTQTKLETQHSVSYSFPQKPNTTQIKLETQHSVSYSFPQKPNK